MLKYFIFLSFLLELHYKPKVSSLILNLGLEAMILILLQIKPLRAKSMLSIGADVRIGSGAFFS
ncbi:MAG: hypothetical protein IPO26_16370 [Saprospiraceae bacterium]|nr:hypothetical protein [Saprospiraceae bacterium]